MKISLFFLALFPGYSKSWDVCSQLGQSEGYQDLATRQELIAFALTHCPPSSIELLLAASSSLKTEVSVPNKVSAPELYEVYFVESVDLGFVLFFFQHDENFNLWKKIVCHLYEKGFEDVRI